MTVITDLGAIVRKKTRQGQTKQNKMETLCPHISVLTWARIQIMYL